VAMKCVVGNQRWIVVHHVATEYAIVFDCCSDCSHCGNDICVKNETNCCEDCGPICGDGLCNCGESTGVCCGSTCGDGICCLALGETSITCCADCGSAEDGICWSVLT